jgi:hypothetical protein
MRKTLLFGYMAVLLLPVAAWPARARAAQPAPSAAAGPAPAATAPGRLQLPNAGQLSTLFRIDDANPESTVPTSKQRDGNPLEFGYYVQDLLAKAESATKKNDHPATVRYYRALAASIPSQAQGWSRLCEAYEAAGDRERAVGACKYAIDREGAELKDFVRFVDLLVAKTGELTGEERTALGEVLAHLDQQPDMAVPTAHLRCKSAVKTNDQAALEACTAVLAKVAPDDPKTIVFQWSLAVMRGQGEEAARLLGRAEKAGLGADKIEQMTRVAAVSRSWTTPVLLVAAAGAMAALLALLLRRRLGTRSA